AWSLEWLSIKRSIALRMALSSSTQANYSSALNSYLTFCKLHHIHPEHTTDTLSYYIAYMSHHIKPCSVHTCLTGITKELEPYYPQVNA
ncbi:hypothetical protein PAXRUDRAFT_67497, partial [Paxillus rubicundulus Ve08.2h10]